MKDNNSFLSAQEVEEIGFNSVGVNVRISRYAHFYGVEHISIGDHVRIDDCALISAGKSSSFGSFIHVASHAILIAQEGFNVESFANLSPNSTVLGQTDNFKSPHIANAMVPLDFRNVNSTRVLIPEYVVIGVGSTVLPSAKLQIGVALGAMSLLNSHTDSWTLYAGIPAKPIGRREIPTNSPKV